jgi:hypothetical protein
MNTPLPQRHRRGQPAHSPGSGKPGADRHPPRRTAWDHLVWPRRPAGDRQPPGRGVQCPRCLDRAPAFMALPTYAVVL